MQNKTKYEGNVVYSVCELMVQKLAVNVDKFWGENYVSAFDSEHGSIFSVSDQGSLIDGTRKRELYRGISG